MPQEIKRQPISPETPRPEPSLEIPSTPETREREEKIVRPEKTERELKKAGKVLPGARPQVIPDLIKQKSETLKQIESILSENLEDLYKSLPDNLKQEFKEKGEKTASKIEEIIHQAKVVVHKIVDLIRKWLLTVPGVNKFFLEQETKIKADKILALAEKEKKEKI